MTTTIPPLLTTLPFRLSYESPLQSFAINTSYSIAHGLGTTPKLVYMHLVCNSAELGYSVGDVIFISTLSIQTPLSAGSYQNVFHVSADATNVQYYIQNNLLNGFQLPNKNSAGYSTANASNWRIKLYAFA